MDRKGHAVVTGESDHTGQGRNIVTRMYNEDGSPKWTDEYDNPAANGGDVGLYCCTDIAGDVYVCGYTTVDGHKQFYVRKLAAADGLPLHEYTMPNTSGLDQVAVMIKVDNNGFVYACGYQGTPDPGSPQNPSHYITVKLDAATLQPVTGWPIIGTEKGAATAIAVGDDNGDVDVTGWAYKNGNEFTWATIQYAGAGTASSTGAVNWEKYVEGTGVTKLTYPAEIACDRVGQSFITGTWFSDDTQGDDYLTLSYAVGDPQTHTTQELWRDFYNRAVVNNNPTNDLASALSVEYKLDGSAKFVTVTGRSRQFGSANNVYATLKYAAAGGRVWSGTGDKIYGNDNTDSAATSVYCIGTNEYVTGFSNVSGGYKFHTIRYDKDGGVASFIDSTATAASFAAKVAVMCAGIAIPTGSVSGTGGDDYLTQKYTDNSSTEAPAGAYTPRTGTILSGGVSDLAVSDDSYLVLEFTHGAVFDWPFKAKIEFTLAPSGSASSLSELCVTIESRVTLADVEQTISIKETTSGLWRDIDTRVLKFSNDPLDDVVLHLNVRDGRDRPYDPSNFLDANGNVTIQAKYKQAHVIFQQVYPRIHFDHVSFAIVP